MIEHRKSEVARMTKQLNDLAHSKEKLEKELAKAKGEESFATSIMNEALTWILPTKNQKKKIQVNCPVLILLCRKLHSKSNIRKTK